MPARYWMPLLDVGGAIDPAYLHGAITRWFDDDNHRAVTKPYTLSPISSHGDRFGIEVTVLDDKTETRLTIISAAEPIIRLGRENTRVGKAELVERREWADFEADGSHKWRVSFLTPATFRTGELTSPLPTPSVLLRSPTDCWNQFSTRPERELAANEAPAVRVVALDLRSTVEPLGKRRANAVFGSITYQTTPEVAERIRPLFRLARFSGVGAFRGRGFGVVEVEEL